LQRKVFGINMRLRFQNMEMPLGAPSEHAEGDPGFHTTIFAKLTFLSRAAVSVTYRNHGAVKPLSKATISVSEP
jgi:hypothetical protein